MKPVRALVLVLALAMVPACLIRAYGQQEISPDHFDEPVATQPHTSAAKAPKVHHNGVAYQHPHKHVQRAARHSHSSGRVTS